MAAQGEYKEEVEDTRPFFLKIILRVFCNLYLQCVWWSNKCPQDLSRLHSTSSAQPEDGGGDKGAKEPKKQIPMPQLIADVLVVHKN